MKKKYLTVLVFLALLTGTVSSAFAQEANLDTSVEGTGSVNVNVETQARQEALRILFEGQREAFEAQRLKLRTEIESRRTAAEARGDAVQAGNERMRLELETRRAAEDQRRETLRVEAETRRAQASSTRVELGLDVAKRKVENTNRVILAIIDKLESIIVRLETRIARIKAAGGVTVESEGFVAQAKAHLAEARVSASAFAAIDLSTANIRENFARIRAVAGEAREHIRAAHQSLMLAVRSLGSVEVEVESRNSADID